jgi:hypothetical protein
VIAGLLPAGAAVPAPVPERGVAFVLEPVSVPAGGCNVARAGS